MNETLHYELNPCWDIFEGIYKDIEKIILDRSDLLPATKMTSTELVENAIKYGEFADGSSIQYDLVKNGGIQISVSNRVYNHKHLDMLNCIIDTIRDVATPEELYKTRLMELMEAKNFGDSMLGLYRIAYEGEFHLSCEYKEGLLTVIAKRSI